MECKDVSTIREGVGKTVVFQATGIAIGEFSGRRRVLVGPRIVGRILEADADSFHVHVVQGENLWFDYDSMVLHKVMDKTSEELCPFCENVLEITEEGDWRCWLHYWG